MNKLHALEQESEIEPALDIDQIVARAWEEPEEPIKGKLVTFYVSNELADDVKQVLSKHPDTDMSKFLRKCMKVLVAGYLAGRNGKPVNF